MPTAKAAEKTTPPVDHSGVHAAQRKAGDKLEAERQQRIEDRDNPPQHTSLAAALVAFQRDVPFVRKNQTATVPMKAGGSYRYTYANLTDVVAVAYPLLTKHGLSFSCAPTRTHDGQAYELVGHLMHVSGDTLTGALPIIGRQAQEIGSSLTYNRRYLLGCMTGIITDDDDDGRLAHAAQERTTVQPPETQLTAQDLIERLGDLAVETSTDLAGITAKWRANHNGLAVEHLQFVAADTLLQLVQSIEAYIASQKTETQ